MQNFHLCEEKDAKISFLGDIHEAGAEGGGCDIAGTSPSPPLPYPTGTVPEAGDEGGGCDIAGISPSPLPYPAG